VKKRLFIATNISNEARIKIAAYTDNLRGMFPHCRVSWTKPENLHLTLKFLGNVDESRVEDIGKTIESSIADLPGFSLELADTGVFPSMRKPKVLWIGVTDRGRSLSVVAQQIERHLALIGFPKEGRDFSPHLTIGRVRQNDISREVAEAHLDLGFEPVGFGVDRVGLYESRLTASGPIYSEFRSYGFVAEK
jgi:2'-5' RNA ligase